MRWCMPTAVWSSSPGGRCCPPRSWTRPGTSRPRSMTKPSTHGSTRSSESHTARRHGTPAPITPGAARSSQPLHQPTGHLYLAQKRTFLLFYFALTASVWFSTFETPGRQGPHHRQHEETRPVFCASTPGAPEQVVDLFPPWDQRVPFPERRRQRITGMELVAPHAAGSLDVSVPLQQVDVPYAHLDQLARSRDLQPIGHAPSPRPSLARPWRQPLRSPGRPGAPRAFSPPGIRLSRPCPRGNILPGAAVSTNGGPSPDRHSSMSARRADRR
jgi:hypothetical protein